MLTWLALLLKGVPARVWAYLAIVVAIAAGLLYIYELGDRHGAARVQAKWDTAQAAYDKALAAEKLRQAQIVTRTVIEYRDRIKTVKEKGDEILKEIPILVPSGSRDLPPGFRVLHDAAASGVVPADPGGAAAAADAVEAPAAAQTIAENYTTCRADQARLTALQQLVKNINPQGATQ